MVKLTWIAMIMALSVQMALTQTITFYFDATKGNDTQYDGLSANTAYRTFTRGIQNSVTRINQGTYALIVYSFAPGTYNVALAGSPTITFSSSSPISFNTSGSSAVTIAGTGTGALKFQGGFNDFIFTGFTFSNIIAESSTIQSSGSLQFITDNVDVSFTRCNFNNVAGVSAVGNIEVTSSTVNGVGVPFTASAFKNTNPSRTISISGGTMSNFNGTIVSSLGMVTISSVTFNYIAAILTATTTADSTSIRLSGVTANNVQNAVSITSSKVANVQISNSKFSGGGVIVSLNIGNTASVSVTGSSIANYNSGPAFQLIGQAGKLIAANFTSTNFTNNFSSETATIQAYNCTVGIKNCIFTNNSAVITPNVVNEDISVYSSPVYVADSKVSVINTSFTGNAASVADQNTGTFGGAITCRDSSIDFGSVSFNSNGQSDLLCDGPCNSTGQIKDICKQCVRQRNGACETPITSSAVTSGLLPAYTTGSPTTASFTSGREITTAAFRPTTTGASNINNAATSALSALLLMIALLMV